MDILNDNFDVKEIWIIFSKLDFYSIERKSSKCVLQDIVGQQKEKVETPKPLRFLIKVEKPVPRPPTPGVDVPNLVCVYYIFE